MIASERADNGHLPGALQGAGGGAGSPECRATRAAMHDYLDRCLPPLRQERFEAHLDGCAECIRTFIDVREVAWARRAALCPA
ncbi:zf-HC2 domain-containing protein [Promicromonospora sp. NPDC050880]|uniref:zf-HC2 domain-containing protein n=1 Tax=unclassified Promicromonospora TaxID=2647929 RepID=UPI0037B9EB75